MRTAKNYNLPFLLEFAFLETTLDRIEGTLRSLGRKGCFVTGAVETGENSVGEEMSDRDVVGGG